MCTLREQKGGPLKGGKELLAEELALSVRKDEREERKEPLGDCWNEADREMIGKRGFG